jgi:hypothetical protein
MKHYDGWRGARVVLTPDADRAIEVISHYLARTQGIRPSMSNAIRFAVLQYAQMIEAEHKTAGAA